MTCWEKKIEAALDEFGETWNDVVAYALGHGGQGTLLENDHKALTPESWLTREFDGGYGSAQGGHWTLWTQHRVYFPTEYDGAEGVACISRNPMPLAGCSDHCQNLRDHPPGAPASLYEGNPKNYSGGGK